MKLRADLTINGKPYKKGDEIPGWTIYGFFGIHMLMFGASGFFMAYSSSRPDVLFLYIHGGIAILVYTIFYLVIFGLDEVKWMFINASLGILAIYSQIDWLLSLFDRRLGDFPLHVHVIPFLYFILYTFLLRQAVLDLTSSREDDNKKRKVEYGYITTSVAVYLLSGFVLHERAPADETSAHVSYYTEPAGNLPRSTNHGTHDTVTAKLKTGDGFWDQRRYADAYQAYSEAYEAALALDYWDESRNRKLAFSSSGRMATACTLGKWEEADQAMAELKERYRELKPENQKKMDYWIKTGEPRLQKRQC
jgi:hypothetical protein